MAAGSSTRPRTSLAFHKYEGTGNDFIVVDADSEEDLARERAVRLCDRHFGVGADGVLVVLPPRTATADARMRVVNADGSVPEMCGNGARCVALHVAQSRGIRVGTVRLDTDAGLRPCAVENASGEGLVTVEMGSVRVLGDLVIDIEERSLEITIADAGNPHAVLFGNFSRDDIEWLGPRLSTHAAFRGGTNVGFARYVEGGIDLTVWERGVGITLACGTGACAAVAVACAAGRVTASRPVRVRLPGGPLEVTAFANHNVTLRGTARRVFSGTAFA
ncbi:MAG: diaminopimelate epimerase [Myxococcota bacterium]|nr:diaminopimelate epimerase [Myxococcota bacterium]